MLLLVSVPLVDVVLLAATALDLSQGATATFAHGLAAAYIGFSVAFGHVTISWLDSVFSQKFAGAEPPPDAPSYGWLLLRSEIIWWLRCLLAVIVTQTLVFLSIYLVNDPTRTEELELWLKLPLITLSLWFLFGPLWVLIFNWSKQGEVGE